MENGFLFPCENLSYILGFLFLFEDDVILVSPWITDFLVIFPLNGYKINELSLSESINFFSSKKRISLILSKEIDKSTEIFLRRINKKNVRIKKVENLHAKLIVTSNFIYFGSANITYSGTRKNIEICKFERNKTGNSYKYIRNFLQISI